MHNCILYASDQMPYYTDVARVLWAFGQDPGTHHWLVTDTDLNLWPDERFKQDVFTLSDSELRSALEESPYDIQFNWAVFSAIPQSRISSPKLLNVIPYADGNPSFWEGSPAVQHPLADFEVVCWDSSAVIIVSRKAGPVDAFCQKYSDAVPLDVFNEQTNGPGT